MSLLLGSGLDLIFVPRSAAPVEPRHIHSIFNSSRGVSPQLLTPQFSALDALAGMMMKGAAKCDKHAE